MVLTLPTIPAQFIKCAASEPIYANSGTVPDMTEAVLDLFQPMTFGLVNKMNQDYQVIENMQLITFRGIWMPLHGRELLIKPEGERKWNWVHMFSDSSLAFLNPDDVIVYIEGNHATQSLVTPGTNYFPRQYRVMLRKNWELYQYMEWHLITDYTGAGPSSS